MSKIANYFMKTREHLRNLILKLDSQRVLDKVFRKTTQYQDQDNITRNRRRREYSGGKYNLILVLENLREMILQI